MARSLIHSPPSSTVARLLDASAAARAIGGVPLTTPNTPAGAISPAPQAPEVLARPEYILIKRELTLSPATDATFEQLIELYRGATGARLSASHLTRAMLKGLAHCLPSLQREAARIGRLKLPSNAREREQERELFERRIARAFIAGIRAAAALEPD